MKTISTYSEMLNLNFQVSVLVSWHFDLAAQNLRKSEIKKKGAKFFPVLTPVQVSPPVRSPQNPRVCWVPKKRRKPLRKKNKGKNTRTHTRSSVARFTTQTLKESPRVENRVTQCSQGLHSSIIFLRSSQPYTSEVVNLITTWLQLTFFCKFLYYGQN